MYRNTHRIFTYWFIPIYYPLKKHRTYQRKNVHLLLSWQFHLPLLSYSVTFCHFGESTEIYIKCCMHMNAARVHARFSGATRRQVAVGFPALVVRLMTTTTNVFVKVGLP